MTNRSDLEALAVRAGQAAGRNAALGEQVLLACGWSKTQTGSFMGPIYHWSPPGPWKRGNGFAHDDFYRHDPTASLDAALTLVPEGWMLTLKQWPEKPDADKTDWFACLTEDGGNFEQVSVEAATAALALCAAALKARAHAATKGETDDR